jgi:hypothetical protein
MSRARLQSVSAAVPRARSPQCLMGVRSSPSLSSGSTYRVSRVSVTYEDPDKHFSTTCVLSHQLHLLQQPIVHQWSPMLCRGRHTSMQSVYINRGIWHSRLSLRQISKKSQKISYEPHRGRRNFIQVQTGKNLLRKWSSFCKNIL